jgi:ABC-type Fe3+/spermidine/putrescine transport system ATPase subunit
VSNLRAPADQHDVGRSTRLEVAHVGKRFRRADGQWVDALDDVSMRIERGEMIILLGPSGCGKTTLLRCVAGLEFPDSGQMHLDGRLVYDREAKVALPPNKRDINMMFQTYALWPHMTLIDNVAYPLRVSGVGKRAAHAKALEYLELVGLPHLGMQYASQVSGGQQQRVALARTLVAEPALVLFDEPLSNVDAKVRTQLRAEISRLHRELGFAALYVTHDQAEAMALGDRVAVMNSGRIEEFAKPSELYARPTTRFAAEFLGSANVIAADVTVAGTSVTVRADAVGETTLETALPDNLGDRDVALMWRPENARIVPAEAEPEAGCLVVQGTVDSSVYAGPHTEYIVATASGRSLQAWLPGLDSSTAFSVGDPIQLVVPQSAVRLIAS